MKLKTIQNFDRTRDAARIAEAIDARVSGAKLFLAPAATAAPGLKQNSLVA